MRRFFIHIGTHKTGTTHIQRALRSNKDRLADFGFIYPNAGIIPEHDGHHNIAWEVSADRRHDRKWGTVDQLLCEVGLCNGNVIISSEDFSSALADPGNLDAFFSQLERQGFQVNVIVYLRSQVDYIKSLYVELLKHGFSTSFDLFLEHLLDRDTIQSAENEQVWNLNYSSWLEGIPRSDTRQVIVRSYDDVRKNSLLADMFSTLELQAGDFALDTNQRVNESWSPGAIFAQFYLSNLTRQSTPKDIELSNWLADLFASKSLAIREETAHRIQNKYRTSNEELKRRYGISLLQGSFQIEPEKNNENVLFIEDVFSHSTLQIVTSVVGYFLHHPVELQREPKTDDVSATADAIL